MINRLLQSQLSYIEECHRPVTQEIYQKQSLLEKFWVVCLFVHSNYSKKYLQWVRGKSRKQVWAEGAFELQSSPTRNSGAEMATQHYPRWEPRKTLCVPLCWLGMICPVEGGFLVGEFALGNWTWAWTSVLCHHKAAFPVASASLSSIKEASRWYVL